MIFRDMIMLALLGFVALVVILISHIKPPLSEEPQKPPGNVVVEVTWPADLDADVDLWVLAPTDVPVGYSNLNGRVFNLLRDDLGHHTDLSNLNFEVAYSRGSPAGEYVVNVHLYNRRAPSGDTTGYLGMVQGTYPVPVDVVIGLRHEQEPLTKLVEKSVVLNRIGEEITVARFRLLEDGIFVASSLNAVPIDIRSARANPYSEQ